MGGLFFAEFAEFGKFKSFFRAWVALSFAFLHLIVKVVANRAFHVDEVVLGHRGNLKI